MTILSQEIHFSACAVLLWDFCQVKFEVRSSEFRLELASSGNSDGTIRNVCFLRLPCPFLRNGQSSLKGPASSPALVLWGRLRFKDFELTLVAILTPTMYCIHMSSSYSAPSRGYFDRPVISRLRRDPGIPDHQNSSKSSILDFSGDFKTLARLGNPGGFSQVGLRQYFSFLFFCTFLLSVDIFHSPSFALFYSPRANEYQLSDCAKFFLDNVERLGQHSYIPTTQVNYDC